MDHILTLAQVRYSIDVPPAVERSNPTGSDLVARPDDAREGSGPGDLTLAAAAAMGDRDAFEILVRRHGPAVHRFARRMLGDEDAVSDITQETFVTAWRHVGGFRRESSVRTWLFAICARKVADSRRMKRAQPMPARLMETLATSSASDPYESAANAAFLAELDIALAELPVRQRAAWLLREIESLTFTEIGAILDLTPDAARGHHHRARSNLQNRMARWR